MFCLSLLRRYTVARAEALVARKVQHDRGVASGVVMAPPPEVEAAAVAAEWAAGGAAGS